MESRLVQRSLQDDAFRQMLPEDPRSAVVEELGTHFLEGCGWWPSGRRRPPTTWFCPSARPKPRRPAISPTGSSKRWPEAGTITLCRKAASLSPREAARKAARDFRPILEFHCRGHAHVYAGRYAERTRRCQPPAPLTPTRARKVEDRAGPYVAARSRCRPCPGRSRGCPPPWAAWDAGRTSPFALPSRPRARRSSSPPPPVRGARAAAPPTTATPPGPCCRSRGDPPPAPRTPGWIARRGRCPRAPARYRERRGLPTAPARCQARRDTTATGKSAPHAPCSPPSYDSPANTGYPRTLWPPGP